MYPALLLPLVLATTPAVPTVAAKSDPPIQIWINNDRRFFPGDRAKVQVRTEDDGYLIVLHADPDGTLRVLFPLDPRDDNFVRGGRKYEIRGRGDRESFDVDNRSGRGTVYAAVSKNAYRFDEFVLGDHWDYRTLAPNRLPREPETELTDLVRRMAQGSFDYDVLNYDVIERVYASNSYYDRPNYGSVYYGDGWCCSGLSVGLYFGYPYRRPYYYGYAGYDPFYDPFFYDPWYYRPYYYSPVYWYPRPYRYYGYYNHGYYNRYTRDRFYPGHYNPWDGPYRPRGFQSTNTDYRDRRYTFGRAVNTVYTPPIGRFSETESSSPLRRAVDRRESDNVSPAEPARTATPRRATPAGRDQKPRAREGRAEPRRATGTTARPAPSVDRRRVETPGTIEARRAREPEPSRDGAIEARDRRDLPVDMTPRRSQEPVDVTPRRNQDLPVDVSPRRSQEAPEARRAEPEPRRAEPEARPSRSSEDRTAPVERSSPPPARSSGDYDGGRRSSGGSGGGGWQGGGRSDGGRSDGGGRGDGGGRRR